MARRALSRLLLAWAGNCLGLLLAAAILPAVGYSHRAGTLLLAGAILALVNLALRPLVIVMTLPAVLLTLGFSLLLVNTLMLWLTTKFVSGLQVGGFFSTLAAAALISLVNLALRHWAPASGSGRRRRTPRRTRRR